MTRPTFQIRIDIGGTGDVVHYYDVDEALVDDTLLGLLEMGAVMSVWLGELCLARGISDRQRMVDVLNSNRAVLPRRGEP